MIIDKIKNAEKYYSLDEKIKEALLFIKENKFETMIDGKYEINGSEIYASVSRYETKSMDKGSWEAHKNYIDVQYVVEGTEKIGYAPVANLQVSHEYSEEKDITRFAGTGDFVTIANGTFAIFFPGEGHMPGINSESGSQKILKVVVKVIAV